MTQEIYTTTTRTQTHHGTVWIMPHKGDKPAESSSTLVQVYLYGQGSHTQPRYKYVCTNWVHSSITIDSERDGERESERKRDKEREDSRRHEFP